VISLHLNGKQYFFEGVCEGRILKEPKGLKGFGYDPIFQPMGFSESFAEMSMEQKGEISHRGRAVRQLIDFLQKEFQKSAV
jgi:XTP/dITP diphosphohydrolase